MYFGIVKNVFARSIENRYRLSNPGMSKIDWDRAATIQEQNKATRSESPALVVLPDTRVRCVQDELNPRILAQLLGEREADKVGAARARKLKKEERERAEAQAVEARRRRILYTFIHIFSSTTFLHVDFS